MGKKDDGIVGWKIGGRPGREHPQGWTNGGDRSEEDGKQSGKDNSPVWGFGKDGKEGWHNPSN